MSKIIQMGKYFDKKNNRLVFIEEKADSKFWDRHWDNYKKNLEKIRKKKVFRGFVVKYTNKFLKPGSKILEGGCGLGANVYALFKLGYRCTGVDYTPKTINLVKKNFPELDVRVGDVRKLKFNDDYFDGYFSLGVIEHFYDGYDKIAKEMSRVIKNEGYLFLTFPHMSLLRKIKAKLGLYPLWDKKIVTQNFYQFALDEKGVIEKMKNYDFKLVEKHFLDGTGGLMRESKLLEQLLKRMIESNNFFNKLTVILLNFILKIFSSHVILLILKKERKRC